MAPTILKPEVPAGKKAPYVDGAKILVDGKVKPWSGACSDVLSPVFDASGKRVVIGKQAVFTTDASLSALDAAVRAWDKGRGAWPRFSLEQRVEAVEGFLVRLMTQRAAIVDILQWEICKSDADAAKEFDRTMEFVRALIKHLRGMETNVTICDGGVHAMIRRSPVGVMMNLGPMNYPFNETYATLIPALLCGNTLVMKIPNIGGLAHVLTMEAFAASFPPGVVNFVAGRGRDTMPPIMSTGKIDLFAFIGSSKAADALIRQHPQPHRLRSLLSLDGKNLAIVMPDADLDLAVKECLTGSTSFNGQRCTALKLLVVHKSIAKAFNNKFVSAISALTAGPPFGKNAITPLPEPDKPQYIKDLVADAKSKGADVINEYGGLADRTLVFPAVVFPVTKDMRLYHEEQFGPAVAIAEYEDIEEVLSHLAEAPLGQQVSLFTGSTVAESKELASVLDACALATCRVNVNSQCQRGPDTFPFAGRKSSALGTISVTEVLRAVSVETMVAAKSEAAVAAITKRSRVFAAVKKEGDDGHAAKRQKVLTSEETMPLGDTFVGA